MKEIQQLRKVAVKLGVSGTVIPLAETRLYKGGYGFVVLQAYVPYTQNRSPTTSPLCTVHRTTLDKFGNRKQFNKDIYNLLYVDDTEIENAKYMVFEAPLPKAFTDTVGELELVFTYSEVNAENKAATRLASGIYKTTVGDSEVPSGETVDPVGGELARLNDMTVKVEQLEDSVDALLQPPDNTDADKVGTPKVELTEDGRLKFIELKGDKGETGEFAVGAVKTVQYDQPAKVTNSGTTSDAVLDFEIPQGKPAFVKIGRVVTIPPESEAQIVNVGTENDPVLDFYIPEGVGFKADKTYPSVEAMNAGFATDGVRIYGFVIIDTGNTEDEDNAKLYIKTPDGYEFLTDLSGAQGIKGDKGDKGEKGNKGDSGPYYIPNVNDEGYLTWTNTGGLPNPNPFLIRDDTPVSRMGTAAGTFNIVPNVLYVWDEVESLDISLTTLPPTGDRETVEEYHFFFNSGATPTELTLPDTILWSGLDSILIESNTRYEVSITENSGILIGYSEVDGE